MDDTTAFLLEHGPTVWRIALALVAGIGLFWGSRFPDRRLRRDARRFLDDHDDAAPVLREGRVCVAGELAVVERTRPGPAIVTQIVMQDGAADPSTTLAGPLELVIGDERVRLDGDAIVAVGSAHARPSRLGTRRTLAALHIATKDTERVAWLQEGDMVRVRGELRRAAEQPYREAHASWHLTPIEGPLRLGSELPPRVVGTSLGRSVLGAATAALGFVVASFLAAGTAHSTAVARLDTGALEVPPERGETYLALAACSPLHRRDALRTLAARGHESGATELAARAVRYGQGCEAELVVRYAGGDVDWVIEHRTCAHRLESKRLVAHALLQRGRFEEASAAFRRSAGGSASVRVPILGQPPITLSRLAELRAHTLAGELRHAAEAAENLRGVPEAACLADALWVSAGVADDFHPERDAPPLCLLLQASVDPDTPPELLHRATHRIGRWAGTSRTLVGLLHLIERERGRAANDPNGTSDAVAATAVPVGDCPVDAGFVPGLEARLYHALAEDTSGPLAERRQATLGQLAVRQGLLASLVEDEDTHGAWRRRALRHVSERELTRVTWQARPRPSRGHPRSTAATVCAAVARGEIERAGRVAERWSEPELAAVFYVIDMLSLREPDEPLEDAPEHWQRPEPLRLHPRRDAARQLE